MIFYRFNASLAMRKWNMTSSTIKLLFLCLVLYDCGSNSQQFGSLDQKITFYPTSLVISHSTKPLTFYDDTRMIHISLDLPAISMGKPMAFSNHSCSRLRTDFYNQLLTSMLQVQDTAQRLLSLPGYSTLIECNTYLARYFQFETGIPARMVCPRAYRNTVKKCKIWALRNCEKLTTDERNWMKFRVRKPRSSWYCHAGLFGIFRAIYKSTGHTCETNHVKNLKSTLKTVTAAMGTTQHLIHVVNGKVVHLFKITDKMNTKLNGLIDAVRKIDKVFEGWKKELERQANKVECDDYLNMAFLSKFAAENNRAFSVVMRFFEVQDIMTQLTQLNRKKLFGSADLPQFVFSEFITKLRGNPKLKFTIEALKNNLPILANPIVDVQHSHNSVTINILAIVPEVPSRESFCTIEHLTPLKFNISNACYQGPVGKPNLALITCPYKKHIISTSTLDKCFVSDNAVLCPTNVLQVINDVEWLGFPWSSGVKLTYPRYHLLSKSCDDLHPMIHLGGRYYLSTTTGTLTTNAGTLTVSPLTIYHFPCNITFRGMRSGLSTCPQRLEITLPIFQEQTLHYVPWNMKDNINLKLHYDSLQIPKPIVMKHNITDQLNKLYDLYDQQLNNDIDNANKKINDVEEDNITTFYEIVTYTVAAITIFNTIMIIALIVILCRKPQPPQAHCQRCNKPRRRPIN